MSQMLSGWEVGERARVGESDSREKVSRRRVHWRVVREEEEGERMVEVIWRTEVQ